MTEPLYKLRFWGVRGSVPTPALEKLRYGGNTSCASVPVTAQEHLILDCGSGLRLLGDALASTRPGTPARYDVFLSHYHLDHVEGLPFFKPLYDPNSTITFHGFAPEGRTMQGVLETLISPPYCPVSLARVPAQVHYLACNGSTLDFGEIRVSCLPLRHPDGSLSYRLDHGARRIVYATDHEHGDDTTDQALIEFSRGADYLI